jgi:hypothetical protein
MSLPQYRSPYQKYFQPRVSSSIKPAVWIAGVILPIIGIAIYSHWSEVATWTFPQPKKVVTKKPYIIKLSDEQRALTADIDNLPVIVNDLNQSTPLNRDDLHDDQDSMDLPSAQGIVKARMAQTRVNASDVGLNGGISSTSKENNIENPFLKAANDSLNYGQTDETNSFLHSASPGNTQYGLLTTPDDEIDRRVPNQNSQSNSRNEVGALATAISQLDNTHQFNSSQSNTSAIASGTNLTNYYNSPGKDSQLSSTVNSNSNYLNTSQSQSLGLDQNIAGTSQSLGLNNNINNNQILTNQGTRSTLTPNSTTDTTSNVSNVSNVYSQPSTLSTSNNSSTNYTSPATGYTYGNSYRVQQPNFGYGSYRSQQSNQGSPSVPNNYGLAPLNQLPQSNSSYPGQ